MRIAQMLGRLTPFALAPITCTVLQDCWRRSQLRFTKSYLPLFKSPCSGLTPNTLALLFFVNVSMSHRGISWCSESYFSKPHSLLCSQHLYKGQVQCLRGVLLVSSPVRRSNEPSNQCYLFIAQWHIADVASYGVIQASWGTLCGATSGLKLNVRRCMAAILHNYVLFHFQRSLMSW